MVNTLLQIALVGIVAWLIIALVPMPHVIATIVVVAAVIMCVLLLLRTIGVNTNLPI